MSADHLALINQHLHQTLHQKLQQKLHSARLTAKAVVKQAVAIVEWNTSNGIYNLAIAYC